MADIAIFRINYKSDFIITLESDAGWTTPFCIKFWTDSPQRAFYVQYDGETYTHCAPVAGEPTKLSVQMDDHHLGVGDLKYQIAYHFTVADFPNDTEDEVLNQAAVIIGEDGQQEQVMLDLNGETAPEIEFSLPAYANEQQRIANEEARIQNEETRISAEQVRQQNETQRIAREQARQNNESQRIEREQARQTNESQRIEREQARQTNEELRIEREQARQTNEELRIEREQSRQSNEEQRIANEAERVIEFAEIKTEAVDATNAANAAASLANEKAQLADDKAQLADSAASLATAKAQLAQEKATYAQTQGDYAKAQGDYAKAQGDTAQADHVRAEADHTTAAADHTQAVADTATAASDHTRAESDHTRAESDHAAVEVYVDSLGAFDISAYHATGGVLAKYADLTAALGTDGANIPESLRKGGMSVKFAQSSDNKYVQYRLMDDEWSTTVSDWQGVDDEPTAESNNLAKSGGIKSQIDNIKYLLNKKSFGTETITTTLAWKFDDVLKNKGTIIVDFVCGNGANIGVYDATAGDYLVALHHWESPELITVPTNHSIRIIAESLLDEQPLEMFVVNNSDLINELYNIYKSTNGVLLCSDTITTSTAWKFDSVLNNKGNLFVNFVASGDTIIGIYDATDGKFITRNKVWEQWEYISIPASHNIRVFTQSKDTQKRMSLYILECPIADGLKSIDTKAKNIREKITIGSDGDYTTLREGLSAAYSIGNCDVVVKSGTYDVLTEWATEINNHTGGSTGNILGNGMHVVFEAGAYVTCLYQLSGDTEKDEWVRTYFNVFRVEDGKDFTIENLNIKSSNTRYCVHDEMSAQNKQYIHKYINCNMQQQSDVINSPFVACIGGGFGTNGFIVIDGGIYKSIPSSPMDAVDTILWHTNGNSDCRVTVKDVYVCDSGRISFYAYGDSDKHSIALVCGCSMGAEIYNGQSSAGGGTSTAVFDLTEWNNTIRLL